MLKNQLPKNRVILVILACLVAVLLVIFMVFKVNNKAGLRSPVTNSISEMSVTASTNMSGAKDESKVEAAQQLATNKSLGQGNIPSPIDIEDQKRNPFAVVYNTKSVDAGVHEIISKNGLADYDSRGALSEAVMFCGTDPDPNNYLSQEGATDLGRTWALREMLEMCKGFNSSELLEELTNSLDIQSDLTHYIANSIQALDTIKSSTNPDRIRAALDRINYEEQLPYKDIFGSEKPSDLGQIELENSIERASTLAVCNFNGGCGSNSMPTLSHCIENSCREGSTYQEALQQTLPPREYEATMAFYNWIMQQRGG